VIPYLANVTPYAVLSELEDMIDLMREGSKYVSYAGGQKEFELSDATVTVRNPGLLETAQYGVNTGKIAVVITVRCVMYWSMPFSDLSGWPITIKREAGAIVKF
jgi:hypothetical protein